VSNHSPLRLSPQAKNFTEIMNEARQNKPAWVPVSPDGFRRLQQMLDLGEVCVGITIIDQSIQKLSRLPYRLLPSCERKVLLLLMDHIIKRLMFVIQAIETRDTRISLRVILAELFLRFSLLIAAPEKVVPFFHIGT